MQTALHFWETPCGKIKLLTFHSLFLNPLLLSTLLHQHDQTSHTHTRPPSLSLPPISIAPNSSCQLLLKRRSPGGQVRLGSTQSVADVSSSLLLLCPLCPCPSDRVLPVLFIYNAFWKCFLFPQCHSNPERMTLWTLYLCWPTSPRQAMQLPTLPRAAATINCFYEKLPTISENPQWQILPIMPPSRVLTPLPPSHAVIFAVPSLDPCPSQLASPHKCASAFLPPFSAPPYLPLTFTPPCSISTVWGCTRAWEKRKNSVVSMLFFKTPMFRLLLIISYSLWFF